MTREEFQVTWKRLRRQLQQRAEKVNNKQKPYSYYQNKRIEFVTFINKAKETEWFVMPNEGCLIWNLYYDLV